MTPAHGDLRQTASPGIADKTCSLHFQNRRSPAADHHYHFSVSSSSSQYSLGMCAHKPSRISQADIAMCVPRPERTSQAVIGMRGRQTRRRNSGQSKFPDPPGRMQPTVMIIHHRRKCSSSGTVIHCLRHCLAQRKQEQPRPLPSSIAKRSKAFEGFLEPAVHEVGVDLGG